MPSIDRKFKISATSIGSGNTYTEESAVLFLAKDRAFLPTLRDYLKHCTELGAGPEQLEAVKLMIQRVEVFQAQNETKIPDVDPNTESIALMP